MIYAYKYGKIRKKTPILLPEKKIGSKLLEQYRKNINVSIQYPIFIKIAHLYVDVLFPFYSFVPVRCGGPVVVVVLVVVIVVLRIGIL